MKKVWKSLKFLQNFEKICKTFKQFDKKFGKNMQEFNKILKSLKNNC